MKQKTALKRSISSAKFLAVAVPIVAALAWLWPNSFTLIPLAILVLTLLGDIINILYIRRKAGEDPAYLENKIQ